MQQAAVDLPDGVDARGTDRTPDHGGGEDGPAVGTGEAGCLVGGADVVDVAEHPERHADLSEGTEDSGAALSEEESPRGHFEVVAEFHVLGEVEALAYYICGEDLEDHVCVGWKDELVDRKWMDIG